MNYSLLGWLSVTILAILVSPYVLNFLNRKFIKTKNKNFLKLVRLLRNLHKPLGLLLILIGVIHGIMALGTLRLHTGTILYLFIVITGTLGGSFYKTKNRTLFKLHKVFAFLTVALFLLHFIAPSAIYNILN